MSTVSLPFNHSTVICLYTKVSIKPLIMPCSSMFSLHLKTRKSQKGTSKKINTLRTRIEKLTLTKLLKLPSSLIVMVSSVELLSSSSNGRFSAREVLWTPKHRPPAGPASDSTTSRTCRYRKHHPQLPIDVFYTYITRKQNCLLELLSPSKAP